LSKYVFFSHQELELYKEELLDKPAVLALNKIDEDLDGAAVKEILQKVRDLPGIYNVTSSYHHKRCEFESRSW
jgi:GTPase involved in cell partitioning and DNA repair